MKGIIQMGTTTFFQNFIQNTLLFLPTQSQNDGNLPGGKTNHPFFYIVGIIALIMFVTICIIHKRQKRMEEKMDNLGRQIESLSYTVMLYHYKDRHDEVCVNSQEREFYEQELKKDFNQVKQAAEQEIKSKKK